MACGQTRFLFMHRLLNCVFPVDGPTMSMAHAGVPSISPTGPQDWCPLCTSHPQACAQKGISRAGQRGICSGSRNLTARITEVTGHDHRPAFRRYPAHLASPELARPGRHRPGREPNSYFGPGLVGTFVACRPVGLVQMLPLWALAKHRPGLVPLSQRESS